MATLHLKELNFTFFLFQEGRTSSPSLSGPVSLMTPREEMLETKYHQPDTCVPGQHYLEHHRQAMLLSLPTKTEVIVQSDI